jgi:pyruvate/2-oxoglutarate/acetoin dehydrogenase E1 component
MFRLKSLYYQALDLREEITKKYEKIIEEVNKSEKVIVVDEKKKKSNFNDNNTDMVTRVIKRITKKIALKTHPDKIKDEKLNKYFIEMQDAKERCNLLDIMYIHEQIYGNIDFIEENEIKSVIEYLEKFIVFMKNKK